MQDMGYDDLQLGPEPEFFLFKLDKDGNATTELSDTGGYFDLQPNDFGEDCRRDITLTLEDMGLKSKIPPLKVQPASKRSVSNTAMQCPLLIISRHSSL